MFFSVGIPVYNSEKYLSECLDSILSQDFKDFEIILVDDGSTDSSGQICDNYAKKDNRIKVFHQENGGISIASNAILEKLSGEYTFLMDNDDTMCAGVLSKVYSYIIENDYPEVVQCGYNMVNSKGSETISVSYCTTDVYDENLSSDERFAKYFSTIQISGPLWTKFIKTECFEKYGLKFRPEFSGCQDTDFSYQLFGKVEKVKFYDIQTINFYHPREGSVSSEYSFATASRIIDMYIFWLKKCEQISGEYGEKATNQMGYYLIDFSAVFRYFDKDKYSSIISKIEKTVGARMRKLPFKNDKIGYVALCSRFLGFPLTMKLVYILIHRIAIYLNGKNKK